METPGPDRKGPVAADIELAEKLKRRDGPLAVAAIRGGACSVDHPPDQGIIRSA